MRPLPDGDAGTYQIANFTYPAVWAYYIQGAFGWDGARMVGLSLAYYGVSIAVVQAGLIRAILPRLGETRAVVWGLILNTVCLVLYGFVTQGWDDLGPDPDFGGGGHRGAPRCRA